jgi:hypothetical protein
MDGELRDFENLAVLGSADEIEWRLLDSDRKNPIIKSRSGGFSVQF